MYMYFEDIAKFFEFSGLDLSNPCSFELFFEVSFSLTLHLLYYHLLVRPLMIVENLRKVFGVANELVTSLPMCSENFLKDLGIGEIYSSIRMAVIALSDEVDGIQILPTLPNTTIPDLVVKLFLYYLLL